MAILSPINSFQTQRIVRMVDTDCSGTAHVSALIRMMEETEYAFLRSCGLSVVLSDEKGIMGFPRLSAEIQLHQPARFDEDLLVELNLLEIDGKHIVYQFEITLLTGQQVASGRFRVACCRFPNGKPPYAILTPANVIEALTSK